MNEIRIKIWIEDLTMVRITATVVYALIVFTLGVVCGPHSVWTYLRKKGHVTND